MSSPLRNVLSLWCDGCFMCLRRCDLLAEKGISNGAAEWTAEKAGRRNITRELDLGELSTPERLEDVVSKIPHSLVAESYDDAQNVFLPHKLSHKSSDFDRSKCYSINDSSRSMDKARRPDRLPNHAQSKRKCTNCIGTVCLN